MYVQMMPNSIPAIPFVTDALNLEVMSIFEKVMKLETRGKTRTLQLQTVIYLTSKHSTALATECNDSAKVGLI